MEQLNMKNIMRMIVAASIMAIAVNLQVVFG